MRSWEWPDTFLRSLSTPGDCGFRNRVPSLEGNELFLLSLGNELFLLLCLGWGLKRQPEFGVGKGVWGVGRHGASWRVDPLESMEADSF